MEFIRQLPRFHEIGALNSCSDDAARFALRNLDLKDKVVCEFGCGTGVFTKEIEKQKPSLLLGFEVNPRFSAITDTRCPGAQIINDSAAKVGDYLESNGHDSCDYIISTLPWSLFDSRMQDDILDSAYASLRQGGRFITIGYVFSDLTENGRRLKRILRNRFRKVLKTKMVWKNLPPAFFYTCLK